MICCGYVVCWSFSEIAFFLNLIGAVSENFAEWWLLVQLNSCINPFIYAAKYRDFQAGVRKMLKKKKNVVNVVNVQASSVPAAN